MAFRGSVQLPGDKSISHRAAIFAALGEGESRFENFSQNDDCRSTLQCLRQLGIEVMQSGEHVAVKGKPLTQWRRPAQSLYAGNSGTTARLLSGVLIHLPFATQLTGDESLSRRPMRRITDPLRAMGARIESNEGHLPLTFSPAEKISGIEYRLPVASAQIKSAVALAGLYADGVTRIIEETPSRDHTERMLRLQVTQQDGKRIIEVTGGASIPDVSMTIPGDISSAAFFIVGALLTPDSDITVHNVSLNPTRTAYLDVLQQMGASLEIKHIRDTPEPMGHIRARYSPLQNHPIPAHLVPNLIDEIPILTLAGLKAAGRFEIKDARELRVKETDRIHAMVHNLKQCGITVDEKDDGYSFCGPQKIKESPVKTFGDHRIAMTFAIAARVFNTALSLDNPDCVSVSFPEFYTLLNNITGE